MIKLVIKREKKFASALLPYWVIAGISKSEFMNQGNITEDKYRVNETSGQYYQKEGAVTKITINGLDRIGIKVSNGQTVEVMLDDKVQTVFACTTDGRFSNEVRLAEHWTHDGYYEICLSTKGGLIRSSYPYIKRKKNL